MTDDAKDLAREVAEKVMGTKVNRMRVDSTFADGRVTTHYEWRESSDGQSWAYLKLYDRNISDAWLVVEKMRERGWSVLIGAFQPKHGWSARFIKIGREIAEYAPTPSEAICRAALSAIERFHG